MQCTAAAIDDVFRSMINVGLRFAQRVLDGEEGTLLDDVVDRPIDAPGAGIGCERKVESCGRAGATVVAVPWAAGEGDRIIGAVPYRSYLIARINSRQNCPGIDSLPDDVGEKRAGIAGTFVDLGTRFIIGNAGAKHRRRIAGIGQ